MVRVIKVCLALTSRGMMQEMFMIIGRCVIVEINWYLFGSHCDCWLFVGVLADVQEFSEYIVEGILKSHKTE